MALPVGEQKASNSVGLKTREGPECPEGVTINSLHPYANDTRTKKEKMHNITKVTLENSIIVRPWSGFHAMACVFFHPAWGRVKIKRFILHATMDALLSEGLPPMATWSYAHWAIASVAGWFVLYLFSFVLRFLTRHKKAPPDAYVGAPIVGNYLELGKNPINFIKQGLDKYGPIFTVPMMHKNLTFVLGPEVSKPFYSGNSSTMSQNEVYGFMTPIFGEGVVYDAVPEAKWMKQRNSVSGHLSSKPGELSRGLVSYVAKIEKETIDYLKRWGDSGTVNILDALSELTILTASRCLHGDDVRDDMYEDVSRIFHDLDQGLQPYSVFFPYLPTEAHKKRDVARQQMVNCSVR